MQTLQQQWAQCQTILADNLTTSAYQTWFGSIVPLKFAEGKLTLQVKSQFYAEYIEENYIQLLSAAIFRVFGQGTRLEYKAVVDSASGAGTVLPSAGAPTKTEVMHVLQQQQPVANTFDTQLNNSYTFDTFIKGEPNKLARNAAWSIADKPGTMTFNPLIIYGGSGVGKTHLAYAIGNEVHKRNPYARVLYVSANTFKLQYTDAARNNKIPDFINFYQAIDVLIVDDIQYFAGLKGTQDTFFHIFNYLHQSRKQIIMTCDRPLLELKDIDDRILTRFKWGLAAEIAKPDYQLRRDILLNKLRRDGIELSDEIIDFIAQNVRESVRDLEGVVASLLAHSTLTDREIDMSLTEKVVGNIVALQPRKTTVDDVINVVASYYNITPKMLMAQNRSHEVSQARHVALYLSKILTDSSLNEIGFKMGRRTHSTVLHSIAIVKDQLEFDPVMRQRVSQIEAAIKG